MVSCKELGNGLVYREKGCTGKRVTVDMLEEIYLVAQDVHTYCTLYRENVQMNILMVARVNVPEEKG